MYDHKEIKFFLPTDPNHSHCDILYNHETEPTHLNIGHGVCSDKLHNFKKGQRISIKQRPNKKKIPVLRVTGPFLNLLLKPRIFSGFLEKINTILCILKGEYAFQNE